MDKIEIKDPEVEICGFLNNFNEGRSKTYYAVSATILKINELKATLAAIRERKWGADRHGQEHQE
jgi:DNA-binding IclR family transcriptional regulator